MIYIIAGRPAGQLVPARTSDFRSPWRSGSGAQVLLAPEVACKCAQSIFPSGAYN